MTNTSDLLTAIKAYNVSECVRGFDGEIMSNCLIPEDLNLWAGLEVVTVQGLNDWLNFQQGFSDFHKEVHGVRPRWNTLTYTLSDWHETYETLDRINKENIEAEKLQAAVDVQSFKDAVLVVRRSGAKDFMTAIRWMLQAEGINPRYRQDVETFFYGHRILFTDYGRTLINRICPQRKR